MVNIQTDPSSRSQTRTPKIKNATVVLGRKSSRIAIFKLGVDPTQEVQYPELHRWMLEKMDRFRTVFSSRVRELSIVPEIVAPDEELPEE